MKRTSLATLLGVLLFAVLSTFTQHRAAADRMGQQQAPQSTHQTGQAPDQTLTQQPNKTIVNEDRTITLQLRPVTT